MEKEEYWESFFASGKVTDYLSYRHAADAARDSDVNVEGAVAKPDGRPEDKVKHNAGFY